MKKLMVLFFMMVLFLVGCNHVDTRPNNFLDRSLTPGTKNVFLDEIVKSRDTMNYISTVAIMFQENSAYLSNDSLKVLNDIATWLGKNKDTYLIIEGHGKDTVIARTRAKTVHDYLKLLNIGVDQMRMEILDDGFSVVTFRLVLPRPY